MGKFHKLATAQMNTLRLATRREASALWVVTWAIKGRLRHKLGRVSALAINTSPQGEVLVKCLTARLDPATGVVRYDRVRMTHDLAIPARPGGRGRILDPRERGDKACRKGDLPNASWLRLAIHAEDARRRESKTPWRAAAVPQMPQIVCRYAAVLPPQPTAAFVKLASGRSGHAPDYVREVLSGDTLPADMVSWWEELWTPSEGGGFEVFHEYVESKAAQSLEIFEDFTDMPKQRVEFCPPAVVPEDIGKAAEAANIEGGFTAFARRLEATQTTGGESVERVLEEYERLVEVLAGEDSSEKEAAEALLEAAVEAYSSGEWNVAFSEELLRERLLKEAPVLGVEISKDELAALAADGQTEVCNVLRPSTMVVAKGVTPFELGPAAFGRPLYWDSEPELSPAARESRQLQLS